MFAVEDLRSGRVKYAARSVGKVTDNRDPQKKGRIKVDHPLVGETPWIPYLQTGYLFDIPEIGDLVYVESDCGFETHPVAWGKKQTNQAETVPMPESFQRTIPTNRGIYSPGGHLLEIDDGEAVAPGGPPTQNIGIRFTTSEESKIHINESPTEKGIIIERPEGQSITIDSLLDTINMTTNQGQTLAMEAGTGVTISSATGDTVTLGNGNANIADAAGNQLDLSAEGIILEDTFGNAYTTTATGITIEDAPGNSLETNTEGATLSTVSGAELVLNTTTASIADATGAGFVAESGKVQIGNSAVELLDIFDKVIEQVDAIATALSTMTVPTSTGPSGPPLNAADFVSAKAQLTSLKTQLGVIKS